MSARRMGLVLALLIVPTAAAPVGAPASVFVRAGFLPFPKNAFLEAIAAGDLTGHNVPDLVAVDSETRPATIDLVRNQGAGSFGHPVKLGSVNFPFADPAALAVADVYGNGRIDVLALDDSAAGVVIFPGDGHGGFGAPQRIALPDVPDALAVGSLVPGGKPDIVAVSRDGEADVVLGQAQGGFAAPARVPAGLSPTGVVLADFNHDGHLDMAVADNGSGGPSVGGVAVLLGNGDGTFRPYSTAPAGNSLALTEADFNRDGFPDLAAVGSSAIRPLIGNGDGTFKVGAPIPGSADVKALVAGNFFADGKPALAAVTTGGAQPLIFRGSGTGTFSAPLAGSYGFQLNDEYGGIVSADFTGDGKADLAVEAQGPYGGPGPGIGLLLNTLGARVPQPTLAPVQRKACYVIRTFSGGAGTNSIGLIGRRFYPGDYVGLRTNVSAVVGAEQTVGSGGTVRLVLSVPPIFRKLAPRRLLVTASDREVATVHASTSLLVAPFSARSSDSSSGFDVRKAVRFSFLGFPSRATIYLHYLDALGRLHKTIRLGRASGACGAFATRIRWAIPHPPRSQAWALQFDDRRPFSPATPARQVFTYTPF